MKTFLTFLRCNCVQFGLYFSVSVVFVLEVKSSRKCGDPIIFFPLCVN